MKSRSRDIQRYTAGERVNHWVVAISFVLLALSGLAFFHPSFFFMTNLFGGGPWTRILHPYIGVVMAVGFLMLMWRAWWNLPVTVVRIGSLVHAISAFGLIGLIIAHIYAAIWTKGTIRAMTRGTVTRGWARFHHPLWFRKVTGEDK